MMKFTAMVVCGESDCAELNAFLAAHRVLRVERQFEGGAWHFLVEYDERGGDAALAGRTGKPPRVDYREVLSAEDFAVFAKLREVRKRLAEAEGVAVFAVATNEQLAQFAKERATTLAALQAVPGFGESRTEKYGKAFIEAIATRDESDKRDESDLRDTKDKSD